MENEMDELTRTQVESVVMRTIKDVSPGAMPALFNEVLLQRLRVALPHLQIDKLDFICVKESCT
jgi:hypothetical protein